MSDSTSKIYFVFIHAPSSKFIPAFLTKFFTGSTAFHCGFLDTSDNTFFDMYKIPRKCVWPRYRKPMWIKAYPADKVTRPVLEYLVKRDSGIGYGYMDYLAFGWRKLLSILGVNTNSNYGEIEAKIPNFNGEICSEMLTSWANYAGYTFPTAPVMSPGEMEEYIQKNMGLPEVELQRSLW